MISKKISLYRTEHVILHYREICSETDALQLLSESAKGNQPIYILGNGSNTFFANRKIRSTILKNKLPRSIEHVGDDTFYISSSTLVSEVLKYCHKNQRESFYYLASVPAEIGGALAMNAGQGLAYGATSIMDFVDKVRFIRDGDIIEKSPDQLSVSYRNTIFTGQTDMFILGAYFRFVTVPEFVENPIKQRIEWAKKHQDLSKPNCGTVFKTAQPKILNRFRGLSMFGATYSRKTGNWIINESKNPLGIKLLISIVILAHRLFFQKCETEIIRVK
jgi:UDP-N-acetylmuramate dehydrogenase